MQTSPQRVNAEGAGIWMIKVFAGLFILVLLGVHFVVNHLVAPGGLLTYADVVRYYDNPWIGVMEVAFLIVVIAHAFIGMRSIFLDLNPSPNALRWVNRILIVAGGFAVIYGTWLVIVISARSVP